MREKNRNRALAAALWLTAFLGVLFCKNAALTVRAAGSYSTYPAQEDFVIQAEMLPAYSETCDIKITVGNLGEDWEGTVRLSIAEGNHAPCAYDTALSLPEDSEKQFVVKVPIRSIGDFDGTATVTLLDRKDRPVAAEEFRSLLRGGETTLAMGILSDDYSKLTYLDMGGEEFYFYDDHYPISLTQLRQEDLKDMLNSLTFLVIDQYNTGILKDSELDAIEQWNRNGGVLIIGTGAYAQDTLQGFDGSYPGAVCTDIIAPQESSEDMSAQGIPAQDAPADYVDFSQLSMAQFKITGPISDIDFYTRAQVGAVGMGSVCLLPYSLTELGELDEDYWQVEPEYFVETFLEYAASSAASRYSALAGGQVYDNGILDALNAVAASNSVFSFGLLKAIVILYVIFAGPLLYLILRLAKRRELYWLAVPVTALCTIGLIFLAGRGFAVVDTAVYSVTVQDLAENTAGMSYLHCYDADRREWNLKLKDGCEYAGPLSRSSYSFGSYSDADSYFYHIRKEGDTCFLGMKPDSNFDDGYFYLKHQGEDTGAEGSLAVENIWVDYGGASGRVTNNTDYDMSYFAVLGEDALYVYEGIAAGETKKLHNMTPLYDMPSSNYASYSYFYGFVSDYYDKGEYQKAGALSALGAGIYSALSQADYEDVLVIGVTEDWEKTVDDDCNEISYGCLYSAW